MMSAGKINVSEGSMYAGVDTVDIVIHGVGAHGAHPHRGKDPIVLGAQIVLALQTLVAQRIAANGTRAWSRSALFIPAPRANIISDRAVLQLTVRNTSAETRQLLLDGIVRIAQRTWVALRVCPKDKLPEIINQRLANAGHR